MNFGIALVNHIRAKANQTVNNSVDRILVTRNQRGCHQNSVALTDDDAVIAVGDSREHGHRLTLAAGRHQHNSVIWNLIDVIEFNNQTGRHFEVAKVCRDAHVANHAAANKGHLAIIGYCRIQHLLHAVNVRGE